MKTQSLKSIATLIVAAGMLSSTVFAGPGPKGAPAEVQGQKTQPVVAVIAAPPKAHVNDFKTAKSTSTPRTPRLVYGAHGGVTVL